MKLKNIDFEMCKKYLPFIIVGMCLLLFGGIYFVQASSIPNGKESNENVILKPEVDIDEVTNDTAQNVLVDIKGAVLYPGVYQLLVGSSVQDAIDMAGGLLENANTNVINLSKRVFDEMVIIIYTNEEIDAYKNEPDIETQFIYIEIPCECPDSMNDACINNDSASDDFSSEFLISINKASKEELMTLNGIGASKAEAIIQYRLENGNFKTIEDIMNVSGIGESAFEKIKNSITV